MVSGEVTMVTKKKGKTKNINTWKRTFSDRSQQLTENGISMVTTDVTLRRVNNTLQMETTIR